MSNRIASEIQNLSFKLNRYAEDGNLQGLSDTHDTFETLYRADTMAGTPTATQQDFYNNPLRYAATHGHDACVAFLLLFANIEHGEYVAVRAAIGGNHPHCLQLLLEHTQLPKNMYQYCLNECVEDNFPLCLKTLVAFFQSTADYTLPLLTSALRQQHDCVDALFEVGNSQHALTEIEARHNPNLGLYLRAKIENKSIGAAVGVATATPTHKKM